MREQKHHLRSSFNGMNFTRWSAMDGRAPLWPLRRSIREGHALMVRHAESWLSEYQLPPRAHVLDAGCGTGGAAIALARRGYCVTAIDRIPALVYIAARQAEEAKVAERIHFIAGEFDLIGGYYDAVLCLDVLIHCPKSLFARFSQKLAQRSRGPLLLTYAPYHRMLASLQRISGLFPKSQHHAPIQMFPESFVQQTLAEAGMAIRRSIPISHGFYHITLIEAYPA